VRRNETPGDRISQETKHQTNALSDENPAALRRPYTGLKDLNYPLKYWRARRDSNSRPPGS
jgi:hypothetical protein